MKGVFWLVLFSQQDRKQHDSLKVRVSEKMLEVWGERRRNEIVAYESGRVNGLKPCRMIAWCTEDPFHIISLEWNVRQSACLSGFLLLLFVCYCCCCSQIQLHSYTWGVSRKRDLTKVGISPNELVF